MKRSGKRLLVWAPRILCVLFAAFVSLFALDVFDQGYGFWETILALLMHLIPTTGIIVVVLVISWRWEWVGGVLFTVLGALYLMSWGQFHWPVNPISGPLLLVGVLFLINWRYRAELRASS